MTTPTTQNKPRILVAGVGNIFLGDDSFGVEVVKQLALMPLPAGVRVADYGIRGLDLAYALLDGYETVVLVDAMQRGGAPGTLYLLEPEIEPDGSQETMPLIETHNMEPLRVIRLALALGGTLPRIIIVGCEPETLGGDDDIPVGMSETVGAAVSEAVRMVESQITLSLELRV
jgi:hydrogenase maturation protease